MELWIARGLAAVFALVSAFGLLNALYLKRHGPGGDLGIIAAILAIGAYLAARSLSIDR